MNPLPIPYGEPLFDDQRLVSEQWERWFTAQAQTLSQAPNRFVPAIALTNQTASIAATTMVPSRIPAGVYRLSYFVRVTTAASVTSSIAVTLTWTDHGQVLTFTGTGLAANEVAKYESNAQLVYVDANTAIQYSTTYASNLANEMVYELYVTVEQVAV